MKLYGSSTSPYVRRLRAYLEDFDHEFININIYAEEGRSILKAINPALKIPMLVDGDQVIFDSRIIFQYLNQAYVKEPWTINDDNNLTLINAANDSYVELFLLEKSGIDTSQDALFFNLQHERIKSTLDVLNKIAGKGGFDSWNFASISLFCLIDWALFRALNSFEDYPHLHTFYQSNLDRPIVKSTDPRD
ncbi:glutathione S-transferase family protein [Nitrincola tibetensis]|uniref:Glutathione S-transferase family protein n=1 Tax=Nitrincola tibetensis TaxID=2219697 RepID=A0A364NNH9_9GAMM|nr:glutathione S-transferase family protein [Nitrincola tibetensis]RAU18656.1 glutathione S-transferase family protein [Nitrincola tibetensis]